MKILHFKSLGDVIAQAHVVYWRSRAQAQGLWGFPFPQFADVQGADGRRWVLTETVGGLRWVQHDLLVEISGRKG